ncbi:MAG: hypothetical protein J6U33_04845 [Paludibacteraceae bacterium]|nr:hypothetical protein [Paludibacteraceae bacterium]
MMQRNEIFTKIYDMISHGHILTAFNRLDFIAASMHDMASRDELSKLRETYHWMLEYMSKGIADPGRMKIYASIKCQCYQIADALKEAKNTVESHDYVYTQKQYVGNDMSTSWDIRSVIDEIESHNANRGLTDFIDKNMQSGKSLEEAHRYEMNSMRMFNYFWLFGGEAGEIESIMNNELIGIDDKCLLVSAMTLYLMRRFDLKKAILLTSLCERHEEEISERALVGLLPLIAKYADRFDAMPEWRDRLSATFDSKGMKSAVKRVIMQYARTNETEELVKQMKEEIIPEMRKLSDDMKKEDIRSFVSDDHEEMNPVWQEKLEKSGLADKLKRYSDLQMEGSDVYMSTFAMLKTFPFFSTAVNWFRPYNPDMSYIRGLFNGESESVMKEFFDAIMDTGSMCDSDRYSFSLSLMQMPASQRKTIADAFAMEKKQELELRKDDEILAKTRKAERVSNSYIQNLYRFYRLFPSKDAFESPFLYSLTLQNGVIAELAAFDDDDKIEIGEYCFSKGFYETAFGLFSSLKNAVQSLEYYQKLGYCKQKVGDMVEAIGFYKQAEVIEPNDVWTIMRLAYCYRKTSEMKLAAEYYAKAEALQSNKSAISFKKALCLLECGDEEEALAIFFRLDYETSGDVKLWRLIAMTSLGLGKFDQAARYVQKIMDSKVVEWEDYVIEAYVKWTADDVAGVVSSLKTAKKLAKNVRRLIEDRMEADKNTLLKAGLDIKLIPLLIDAAVKE